jgi:hypothetical protein
MTTTQFVWKQCLEMGEWEPPEPKNSKTSRFGLDSECWLCGGSTDGKGWHFKDVIGSAFTDFNLAKAVHSKTICQPCAALMKKESWVIACDKHGHSPYFPVKDNKKPFLSNWMFSSHVFSSEGWVKPDRSEVRDLLISPPKPPFALVIASVGKKHVIFRSVVNQDRNIFFVNLDDHTISVNRSIFKLLLADFESSYSLGFSKDSLMTGNYNQAAVMSVGLPVWREVESKMSRWRSEYPQLMQLAHFCGQKKEV